MSDLPPWLQSKENAKARASNAAYQSVVGLFELAEHRRLLHGNGHHMAQKVADFAASLVEKRWEGGSDDQ